MFFSQVPESIQSLENESETAEDVDVDPQTFFTSHIRLLKMRTLGQSRLSCRPLKTSSPVAKSTRQKSKMWAKAVPMRRTCRAMQLTPLKRPAKTSRTAGIHPTWSPTARKLKPSLPSKNASSPRPQTWLRASDPLFPLNQPRSPYLPPEGELPRCAPSLMRLKICRLQECLNTSLPAGGCPESRGGSSQEGSCTRSREAQTERAT